MGKTLLLSYERRDTLVALYRNEAGRFAVESRQGHYARFCLGTFTTFSEAKTVFDKRVATVQAALGAA